MMERGRQSVGSGFQGGCPDEGPRDVPGETIESQSGPVYVNGSVLDEPYLKSPDILMPLFDSVTLGAEELWLMGDNRADSRFRGPIPVSLLRAKVIEISNP